MKNVTPRSLGAATAIAAVLALGSTPALAQDASAPVISTPPVVSAPAPVAAPPAASMTPATPPAPRIVLPGEAAPVPVAQAPEAPAPKAEAPKVERRVARTTKVTKAPARPAEAKAPAPAAAQPAETPAKPATTPVAAIPPAGRTVSDEAAFNSGSRVGNVAQPEQDIRSSGSMLPGESGLIAGGAVVLLGGAALFAMRRRRSNGHAYEPAETVAPLTPTPAAAEPAFAPERAAVRAPAVALAAGPVPEGEAREELLRQMVDAEPDAANPFTSAKARRRRARLILQAREQRERESTQQPFDFRTYQRPSLQTDGARAPRSPAPLTV